MLVKVRVIKPLRVLLVTFKKCNRFGS